jgi:hypothetical protein
MRPHSDTRSSSRAILAARVCGALLLGFVGADHLYEYAAEEYSVLPTIGTLFLLNFISASLVGLLLLAPVRRLFGRFSTLVLEMAALGGLAVAATSLGALLISEQAPLFGFMEVNYRPAILVALASEAAAALSMAFLLLLLLRRAGKGASGSGPLAHDSSRTLTLSREPAYARRADPPWRPG